MGSKSTYLRVLFFVCLAAGPTLLACEAALDFDRSKIQHYKSSDGAVQPAADEDSGDQDPGTDDPDTGTGTGTPDAGPKDAGSDADTGT